jgi:hypothetical protein
MQKGTKVTLVKINPSWSAEPVKLSTKQKVGCRPVKIGTTGVVAGVQVGTGLLLVKFVGRSWPVVCLPEHVKVS